MNRQRRRLVPPTAAGWLKRAVLDPSRKRKFAGCVYILRSVKSGKYCVGSTSDIRQRIRKHNTGAGVIFSRTHRLWKMVCCKGFSSLRDARIEEKKVKSYKGGNAFRKIIRGEMPEWLKGAAC